MIAKYVEKLLGASDMTADRRPRRRTEPADAAADRRPARPRRARHRRDRRRPGRRRRRRRGPRERGRPDLRRGEGAPRSWSAFMIRYTSRRHLRRRCTGADARPARPAADDRASTRTARGTAYTVSVDARDGVTTGISAADRAHTIRVLADSRDRAARPDPARPRLPAARRWTAACCAAPGTPRRRSTWPGWPGCTPAGVLCEIVNDDGSMMRAPGAARVRRRARPAR